MVFPYERPVPKLYSEALRPPHLDGGYHSLVQDWADLKKPGSRRRLRQPLRPIVSENIQLHRIHCDPAYISSKPKATKLSEIEYGKILALKAGGMSIRKIAEKIKNPDNYNRFHAEGRPGATSERDGRVIVRAALLFLNQGSSGRRNLDIQRKKNDFVPWFPPEETVRAPVTVPFL
ncbi:---NA--- [Octopus vulgaris]|uniref:---NA n=1 Tax=Octopus vulgaris TaxID=6645 RepID=A0AA36AQ83_OCTVU|nr:---NA--- [Octopus vulgaris]